MSQLTAVVTTGRCRARLSPGVAGRCGHWRSADCRSSLRPSAPHVHSLPRTLDCRRSRELSAQPRTVDQAALGNTCRTNGDKISQFPASPYHKPAELWRSADLICWMSWWMWCGSSSPLMEMLRASLSVVLGSGQTSEDRKQSAEFSLKSQNQSWGTKDKKLRDVVTAGVLSHQLMEASTAPSHSKKLCGSHDCWSGPRIGQDSCVRVRLLTSGLCSVQTQRLRRACNEAPPPKVRRVTVKRVWLQTLAAQLMTNCWWHPIYLGDAPAESLSLVEVVTWDRWGASGSPALQEPSCCQSSRQISL